MADDLDPLRAAWAALSVEGRRFTEAELSERAVGLDAAVRARNLREYAAAAVVVMAFAVLAVVSAHPLSQVGSAWIAASAVYIAWTIARRGSVADRDWARDGRGWLVAELTRERDLLAGVWRWYLGPMVPGLALFFAGPALVAESAREVGVLVGSVAFGVVVFVGIGVLNQRAARELGAELEALGADAA